MIRSALSSPDPTSTTGPGRASLARARVAPRRHLSRTIFLHRIPRAIILARARVLARGAIIPMPVPSRAIASFARRVVRRSRTTRDRCGAVARCAAVDRFTDAPRTAVALLMASDVWATADIESIVRRARVGGRDGELFA